MKNILFRTLPALTLILCIFPSCPEQTEEPEVLAPEIVEASKETLENGLRLIVQPGDRTPLVSFAVRTSGGRFQESRGEEGFSALLAQLISMGGEGSAPERLSRLGAELSVTLLPDAITFGAAVMAEDAQAALRAVLEMLATRHGDEEVLIQRDLLLQQMRAAETEGTTKAGDVINTKLFPLSPYGSSTEDRIAALESLTPEAFRNFVERALRPENTLVAAVGNLSADRIRELKELCAGWQAAPSSPSRPGPGARTEDSGEETVFVVPAPGNEASVFLARRLPAISQETYYPILAINFILNGQTTFGRLRGLQARAGLGAPLASTVQMQLGGSSQVISTRVSANQAGTMVDSIMAELQTLFNGMVGNARLLEQEIADARNSLLGRLARRTESTAQLAQFIVFSEAYGFSSYDAEAHRRLIRDLSKESLLEAINRHFSPELVALVAVGPSGTLRNQLSRLGQTRIVN